MYPCVQGFTTTITEATRILLSHDDDGDKRLDRYEFADFINTFMHQAGYDFNDVVDYLTVLAAGKVSIPR